MICDVEMWLLLPMYACANACADCVCAAVLLCSSEQRGTELRTSVLTAPALRHTGGVPGRRGGPGGAAAAGLPLAPPHIYTGGV